MRATEHEEGDRATAVLFRMSHADKATLQRDASELGITVQALLERRALGYADAVTRPPGSRSRRQHRNEDELPLTG